MRDFPSGPSVKTLSFSAGTQVQSLVGKRRCADVYPGADSCQYMAKTTTTV